MPLTYTVIKSEKQYYKYCDEVEELVLSKKKKTKDQKDTIDLLTVLIEKWDDDHDTSEDIQPVEMIKHMMERNKMKPVDLARLLGISKSLMSDIFNYRRGLSKAMVRKLAERFAMRQEAFSRPYNLKVTPKKKAKKASTKT